MSYLALYRRFRPSGFDGVIGQDHIIKTLRNQILKDSVGHAYLFCGARGTGKTTLAKIFARAINCESPINGSPCGKCKACLALKNPSNMDIVEMDAASNNKVENVREIRDKVQYPPVNGRYKVYIIDEVHMLTTEAFNALLKTLEEPPKHAVFILATTEQHKLPSTILSRCMRFDFRLISTKEIALLIAKIYDEIEKKYEDEAVMAIAKAGEGSVRDALSVADLCVSFSDGVLTYNDVLQVLGATDSTKLTQLVKCVLDKNTGGVLQIIDELSSLGKSMVVLVKDVISYVRDLIIVKTCENSKDILSIPEDRLIEMKEIADATSGERLLRILEIISGIESNLRYSTSPRVVFETALIKASNPASDYNLDCVMARLSDLEKSINSGKINLVSSSDNREVTESSIQTESVITSSENIVLDNEYNDIPIGEPPAEDEPVYEPSEKSVIKTEKNILNNVITENKIDVNIQGNLEKTALVSASKIWGTVVRKLRTTPNMTILWVACQDMSAEIVGDNFVIITNAENEKSVLLRPLNIQKLNELISEFGNYKIIVKCKNENDDNNYEKDLQKTVDFFGKDITQIK